MTPNRVVAVAAAVLSLALAVLPVVGNFDWTSTAGVLAGLTAVLGITLTWLNGWQKHEARQAALTSPDEEPGDPDALPHVPVSTDVPPDEGDIGHG